ncbi:MAG TPA: ATP-binding protein, partial [Oscillatoriaceae cyanobacterium]
QHTYADRMDEAIEEGLRALALLGIRLKAKPGMGRVFAELLRTKAALGGRRAAELDEAPPVRDRLARLQMKVLGDFLVPAYLMGNETLFAATVLRQTTLSLRHGNGEEAVSAYMGYAVLLAGLGDLAGAYEFGRLALRLAERFGVVEGKCRAQVLYALFSHSWSQPWETLEGWLKAAIETGRQTGDFLFMAYAGGFSQLWDPRTDLASAIEEGRRLLALVRQAGYENALDAASWGQQTRLALCGKTAGPLALGDAIFDEAARLARMQRAHNVSGIAIYWLCKLKLACLARAWDEAWQAFEQAEPVIKALAGSPYMVEFAVYGFQVAAQRSPREGRRLRRFERQMAAWARHCPENFAHHLRLMQAEQARLQGRHAQAIPLYESAIAAAAMTGCAQDEARAQEAAARFFEQSKQARRAGICWRAAHDAYRRWGATAKLRALEAERPELAPAPDPLAHAQLDGSALGLVPQLVESGRLEFATVWKATQAISGEPTIERLLARLMAIVKESAGAQKAILVLYDDRMDAPRFSVQAESLDGEATKLLGGEPLEGHAGLPTPLIHEAIRTRTSVWLDADTAGRIEDAATGTRRARSGLALPLLHQGERVGVLYLENTLLAEAFTPERLPVLQILAGQAAVSLITLRTAERAAYLEAERVIKDLHARELETRVAERTSELREAYGRLIELDRLKTSFLGVVSHELRTPLATIHGFSELLEERLVGELTAEQQDYVRQIKRATMGLKRMVDDLLDFTRAETGNLRLQADEADLAGLIRETLASVAPQLREHGLRLEIQVPDAPAIAALDRGRIAQVLLNLVGNAIKFTPRGGTITVSLAQGAEQLRIEVADTGIGIEPAQCARIFERFYQVDGSLTRRQGGVGLGLAITRLLVEAHGGEIGVESAPGMGSTFWFTLPRHAEMPAKQQSTRAIEG